MSKFSKGFSLIELLIVLAIIAALVAVVTPLALNAIRSAKATKASANLKSISNAIYNYFYVENELPTDVNDLVRDLNEKTYGVAYKENEDGTYQYISFTSDNADISKIHELLPNVSSTIPENEEEYTFLSNGRDTFENMVAKYVLTFNENGIVSPGTGNLIKSTESETFAYVLSDWLFEEDGSIMPNSSSQVRGIFNGDETAENYTVVVDAFYYGGSGGYGIYVRSTGGASSDLKAYCFQVDVNKTDLLFKKSVGYSDSDISSFKTDFSNLEGGILPKYPPTKHHIEITVDGNHLVAYFNGIKVAEAYDDTYSNGWVGLRKWGSTQVVFESVSVN